MARETDLTRLVKRLESWGVMVGSELAALAMTHSSYAYENDTADNERLEFLGDAVLELVVSESLFLTYPDKSEGELTVYRAQLVCETTLAQCACNIGIGSALRLGRGEEAQGGRLRPSLLADAFEALVGAVYLSSGLLTAEQFITRLLTPYLSGESGVKQDFKTAVQEFLQAAGQTEIAYTLLKTEGPPHARSFTAGLLVDGCLRSSGVGKSKKEAEQNAARKLLRQLSD